MIIPYLSSSFAPYCGVDSESDVCLREQEAPGLMSMLVVMKFGAAIHRIQTFIRHLLGHFFQRLI